MVNCCDVMLSSFAVILSCLDAMLICCAVMLSPTFMSMMTSVFFDGRIKHLSVHMELIERQ
jgi:hypothetical protein